MAKSQIITKLTIITLLFAASLSTKQRNKKVSVANNTSNPGLTGEWTDCVESSSVSSLILKNVKKIKIDLPEEPSVVACRQSIKLGKFANYQITLDFDGEKCDFNLNSKFGNFDKRAPTAESLPYFTSEAKDCNDRIAKRKLRNIVEQIEQAQIQKENIDAIQAPIVTEKLMAGLTGEAVVCSDAEKVASLFMKNAKRLNLPIVKNYNVVDCNQQFKIGQYAKYQLSIDVNGVECDFFMHSAASNFDKRKPVKSNEESFKNEFKECQRKLSAANQKVTELRNTVDAGIVELVENVQNNLSEIEKVQPIVNEDEIEEINNQTNLIDVITEEIVNRVEKVAEQKTTKLAGFTGEVTDCVNPESVAELFEKNAKKLKNALTTGYTIVDCKQAIKLGSYYNYALLIDYDGQQCELYLESKQMVYNKRMPTKATQAQFIDLVKNCNDLVATSEQSFEETSFDNSEIVDLVQFMGKELEIAEQLENLFEQMNNGEELEMNGRFDYLFFDRTPLNLDLFEVLEQRNQPLMITEQHDELDEETSSSNSSFVDFDEDEFERQNNIFGIAGGPQEAKWTVAAHMFAQFVVADMLQGKVVYKQNVLESKTQVFAGVMTSAVFSFDGVVCELKAFRAPRADAHLQLYHNGVAEGDANSVFLPTLEFAPYKYDNCVDVFGTETSEFLLNHA